MTQQTSQNPIVSIIIPCYNCAEYILETLNSVVAQTFQAFEIIAIDDGSSDNTLSILREYTQQEPRLTVLAQENTYYIQARMNAVPHAKGQYLLFLDSDDKLAPTYIEKCHAEAEKGADIVYTDLQHFEANNQIVHMNFNIYKLLAQNTIVVAALVRKEKFDAVGGFDVSMERYEDWELWVNLIKRGAKVTHIPEPLFFYRQRHAANSVTNLGTKKSEADAAFYIFSKHYDFYQQHNFSMRLMLQEHLEIRRIKQRYYNNPLRRWYYQTFKPKKYQQIRQCWFDD